ERDQVASSHGGDAIILAAAAAVPARAGQHQGVRDAAGQGQQVAAWGGGRGDGHGIAAGEEQRQAGAYGENVEQIGAPDGFVQQKRSEEKQVERGCGLEEDGVGGGGEEVGEDEED